MRWSKNQYWSVIDLRKSRCPMKYSSMTVSGLWKVKLLFQPPDGAEIRKGSNWEGGGTTEIRRRHKLRAVCSRVCAKSDQYCGQEIEVWERQTKVRRWPPIPAAPGRIWYAVPGEPPSPQDGAPAIKPEPHAQASMQEFRSLSPSPVDKRKWHSPLCNPPFSVAFKFIIK